MTAPTDRNRLDEAASPYLRQHADNPVHWQPWDDAARAAARERDVPIFLSIGYSACHWCHVMAEESFADPDVAAVLNERYVPIKVDREERPDVDSLYMAACRLRSGGCGWPLNVWCTPTGAPVYVDTYIPPSGSGRGPGFRTVLERRAEEWATDRESLVQRGERVLDAVRDELETVPESPGEAPGEAFLSDAAAAIHSRVDDAHGGFGTGQKFPGAHRLRLLLRAAARTGEDAYADAVTRTLDAMAAGGIHDHVGGGFHRYATDRTWTVPHFEKMLYDNAEVPRAYLDAYRYTGEGKYADVVEQTLAFVDGSLSHPDGGFYGTLDARSPPPEDPDAGPEEGAYYVWTPAEVRAAVDDARRADLLCDRYGVTEAGNFEGSTVLTLSADVPSLADEYGVTEDAVRRELASGTAALAEARAERPAPARDEKVVAAWNGLAASTFAEAGLALDPSHAARAARCVSFLRTALWDADDQRLARREKDGDTSIDGYLEDYAFVARGALDCYQATGDAAHLAFALDLGRAVVERFWDADAGALYFTPADGEDLGVRPQHLADRSTPSGVAVAAGTLRDLDAVAPAEGFGDVAETVLDRHAGRATERPLGHATLLAAVDARRHGTLEVTVAADALPDDWRRAVGKRYVPDRLLSVRPPTAAGLDGWLDRLGLDEVPPIWADRDAADGPTGYVCRRACSPPLTDVAGIEEWLAEFGVQ